MNPRVELTAKDWERVHAIARELSVDVDRNELGKAVTYFRLTRSKDKFLKLLVRLPKSDYTRRSRRTQGYFHRIEETCRQSLGGVTDERALTIVMWALRMMTFYQAESEKGSISRR